MLVKGAPPRKDLQGEKLFMSTPFFLNASPNKKNQHIIPRGRNDNDIELVQKF